MTAIALFDYAALDLEDQIQARAAAERIRTLMRRTAEDIVEIGRDLIAMKAKLGHGRFGGWLRAEFEMSESSAQRFMRVAERLGKTVTVTDFTPRVLYELAAPSTPDEVIEKVKGKVAAGEKVTKADVERLKAELAQADERTNETVMAAVEANESIFAAERQALRDEIARKEAEIAQAKRDAERAAERKFKAKASKQSEAATAKKQRELDRMKAEIEAKERALAGLNRQIAELEEHAEKRLDYIHSLTDETAEERLLLQFMEDAKGPLSQVTAAFEARIRSSYSAQFDGQLRAFVRMLDRARRQVAEASSESLEDEHVH